MRHFGRSIPSVLLAFTLALCVFASSPSAHAGKVAIYNTGEDIFEVGPLPESLKGEGVDDYKAGYKCEVFGLFWAYITWWDCSPVIFKDDTFIDGEVVEEAVSAAYSESDMKLGFWAGYGRWLMLLAIVGLVVAGFFISEEDEDEDEDEDDEVDEDQDAHHADAHEGEDEVPAAPPSSDPQVADGNRPPADG